MTSWIERINGGRPDASKWSGGVAVVLVLVLMRVSRQSSS